LKKHAQTHILTISKCSVCCKAFKYSAYIRKHIKSKHAP
jgi:hypothetical protein